MIATRPSMRAALFNSAAWTPRKLGSVLGLWLASQSPLTMAAGMAAQFTAANLESLSKASPVGIPSGAADLWGFFWAKFDTDIDMGGLIQSFLSAGNLRAWRVYRTAANDLLTFAVSADGTATDTVDSSSTTTTGTWYGVYFDHDTANGKLSISIGGAAVAQATHAGGIYAAGQPLVLGQLNAANYTDGSMQCTALGAPTAPIASIRTALIATLYNGGTPCSYAQALGSLPTGHGLVSYWELNEPSGTRVDLHGGNNLTDNNTVTTAAGTCLNAVTTEGNLGQAGVASPTQATQASKPILRTLQNGMGSLPCLRFDGTDDLLAISDEVGIRITNGITICVAINLDATSADLRVLGKWVAGVGGREYLLDYATATGLLSFSVREAADVNTRAATASTFGALSAATNYVVMAGYDPALGKAWISVNSLTQDLSATVTGGPQVTTSPLQIGAADTTTFFKGRIGLGTIVNRAMTQRERQQELRYVGRKLGVAVAA